MEDLADHYPYDARPSSSDINFRKIDEQDTFSYTATGHLQNFGMETLR